MNLKGSFHVLFLVGLKSITSPMTAEAAWESDECQDIKECVETFEEFKEVYEPVDSEYYLFTDSYKPLKERFIAAIADVLLYSNQQLQFTVGNVLYNWSNLSTLFHEKIVSNLIEFCEEFDIPYEKELSYSLNQQEFAIQLLRCLNELTDPNDIAELCQEMISIGEVHKMEMV